jgi:hypothetical protein
MVPPSGSPTRVAVERLDGLPSRSGLWTRPRRDGEGRERTRSALYIEHSAARLGKHRTLAPAFTLARS